MTDELAPTDDPVPLDPDDGPTAWVEVDDHGLIHLLSGSDPADPSDVVTLTRREYQKAGEVAGVIETHIE